MNKAAIGLLLSVFLVGCTLQMEEEGDLEEGRSGTAEQEHIAANALSPNALSPNALSPNALSPNALSPTALDSDWKTVIESTNGADAREFLKYLISCAFSSTDSFSFSWYDGAAWVSETYYGSMGLAPGWRTAAPNEEDKAWVSACLAARVNYYSTTVMISMRGTHSALSTSPSEFSAYNKMEGAFYGNLFSSSPAVYACHNTTNESYSRSLYRDCAAGHVSGGNVVSCDNITRVGACDDTITVLGSPRSRCVDRTDPANTPDDGFHDCGPNATREVIAVYLATPSP